jgi:trehalose 6-phosphate phosphatase
MVAQSPRSASTGAVSRGSVSRRLAACTELALADPRACALFLDVDGTLLEVAATPVSVRVPEELVRLLDRLVVGLDGAIAVISGRLISEIDALLHPLKLAASGVHGAELRKRPEREIERLSPELPRSIVAALKRLASDFPGVIVEPKGPGLAMHYRLAPDAESPILAGLEALLERNAGAFDVTPGKKIFEIVPSGLSKGTALAALSQLPQFRGRVPIMIGDDIGDEPAFAAAEDLGGFALRVAGEHYGPDAADFDDPKGVLAWLTRFADRLAATEGRSAADRSGLSPDRAALSRGAGARQG